MNTETETKQQTIAEFCEKYVIRASSRPTKINPNWADEDTARNMRHWHVTLTIHAKRKMRKMRITFSQGSAHKRPPTAEDVLDCLRLDASCRGQKFEDWCGECGYDSDSRKAEKTFLACQRNTYDLIEFLGHEAFIELQNCEGL